MVLVEILLKQLLYNSVTHPAGNSLDFESSQEQGQRISCDYVDQMLGGVGTTTKKISSKANFNNEM